ncbi:NAD(P)H-dependent oxidoreductase [Lentilactobacillus sp. SPB1-3]|uniref:NAD(P)H-dependent oxidoreductase n=1 Tax=Lentilactobacillus terminaliae TaxID=3003483 RepID=A0ACD5DFC5_9LACO|nr:NAD(P)H-dependent oxidoreductase [Lentilactobacillus sp. SPB1-3]MCZ0976505.1 NAD(P)H-dependent oxidoreductase [Lentilactobacillus sp. SPB1-3]
MKTQILVSHPQIKGSGTQKFLETTGKYFSNNFFESIDLTYPDGDIDIDTEQDRLREADRIIFQFPMYWYQAPDSLSRYMQDVFTRKYVESQRALRDKELGIVVSIGDALSQFQLGGSEHFTLSELMAPYAAFANKAGMKFLPIFPVEQFSYMDESQRLKLASDYAAYIGAEQPFSLVGRTEWLTSQLESIMTKRENKTAIKLIIDSINDRKDRIDDLQENIKLIRDEEE